MAMTAEKTHDVTQAAPSRKTDSPRLSQFEKVKAITDKLEAGIQALFESEAFKQYLKTLSKFHNYSLNNTILIAMQRPNASYVAGYQAWKQNFGRQVQKGAKGIQILAPTPYRKQMEVDKVDPATGQTMVNPDGTTAKELKEIMVPAFKVVNVFDYSDTDGRPLPTIGVNELTGDVQQYDIFYEALSRSCPVPISFEQIDSGAKGYYHTVDHRIAIQTGMSEVQTIKTLVHEMTHQHMHSKDPKELPPDEPKLTRNAKEVEAEAVAYTVAQHYGIETSDYSFAYIAGWSAGKDTPELKTSLDRIRKAADELITTIDGHLTVIYQELGIDPVAEAKAREMVPALQENGLYRYYSTQRPVDIGTYPKPPDNKLMEIHNYDHRQTVEDGAMRAWGYLEYQQPLTKKQADDYELQPAPARLTHEQVQAGRVITEAVVEKPDIGKSEPDNDRSSDRAAPPEKKSVLKDLTSRKNAQKEPKPREAAAPRKSHKPKEETR